jgi:hypothetical protein
MAKKIRLVKIKKNGEVEIFSPADNEAASKVTHVPVASGDRICLESADGEVIEKVKVTHEGKNLAIAAPNGSTQQFVLDGYFDAGVTDVEFVGANGQPLFTSADSLAMHTLLPGQSASYLGHSVPLASGAGGDTGPFGWPKFAIPLAVVGGVGAAALAFGGGGGGGSSGGGSSSSGGGSNGTATPAKNTIQGSFAAGPAVAGNNMEVSAYNAAGKPIATAKVGADGKFTLDLGAYTGVAIVRINGKGGAADYQDEVTGLPIDLNADFLAVINVGSGVNNLSINPLTAIAAKMMGVDVVNDQLDASKLDASKVAAKNAEVAKAFGVGSDVTKLDVKTAVDSAGKTQEFNPAGAVLAALSGLDATNGGMQATINLLVKTLGGPLAKSALSEALMLGAAAAETKLHITGFDVVNAVSKALNAANSSAGYSMNAIAVDDTINGKDPSFKAGDTFTFKVPSGKLAASLEFWLPGATAKGAGTITIDAATNIATYTLTAEEAAALNALADGVESFQVKAAGSNASSAALTERHVYINKADDAPTAVTFANPVTSIDEATLTGGKKVADIVIADVDGYTGGVPTVSDTTNFEVKTVGDKKYELWLKSGVVLDFETGPKSLTTTVTAGVPAGGAASGVVSKTFTVNVVDVNEPPVTVGTIPAQSAINAKAFSLDVSTYFKDVDALDKLTYTITKGTLPAGLTLNANTGMLSGTANTDTDASDVTITAKDKLNLTVSQTFKLGVVSAPAVQSFKVEDSTGATDKGTSGESASFTVTFSEAITSTGTITAVFTVNGTDVTVTATAVSGAKTVTFTSTIPTTTDGSAISLKSLKSEAGKTITGDVTKQPFVEPVAGAIKFAGYTVDNTKPSITATYEVDENTSSDTALKTITLAANETVTWSGLTGTDAASFKLDGGKLTFIGVTDFETKGTYNVSVTGTDGAGNATTQALTINLKDVNDAPVTVGTVSAQHAVSGQDFSLGTNTFFKDVDAGNNGQLTYTMSGAPSGFTIDAKTGVISGKHTGAQTAQSVTVTATDGGGLTATQKFDMDVLVAPTITSKIDSVKNLDVRSDIVLTASEKVTAVAGKYIRIVNDGGPGYEGENTIHSFLIDVTDTTQVTIKDNKITINPKFDLDLANNYHIEIDDGAFKGVDSGVGSVGISDPTAMDFSTVNPTIAKSIDTEDSAKETLNKAAASQKMAAGVDDMVVSGAWLSVAGIGNTSNPSGAGALDVSGGGYVLLLGKDENPLGANPQQQLTGIRLHKTAWFDVNNFGKDDSIYVDDQFNNPDAKNNIESDTDAIQNRPESPGVTRLIMPAKAGQAWLDMTLAPEVINSPTNTNQSKTFATLAELESWTQNNWAVIIG